MFCSMDTFTTYYVCMCFRSSRGRVIVGYRIIRLNTFSSKQVFVYNTHTLNFHNLQITPLIYRHIYYRYVLFSPAHCHPPPPPPPPPPTHTHTHKQGSETDGQSSWITRVQVCKKDTEEGRPRQTRWQSLP